MRLGPVTEPDERKTTTLKKIDDDVISANCDVIVYSPIYDQFETIRKPDSKCMVSNTCISIKVTLYFTKAENRTKKSLAQLPCYCFE